jgi:glucose-1-phosphate cytidylyltransferase
MKVIILAGGAGTRLSEETESKPKPMVEVGDHPMLWHITKHFAHYGFKEFVIALGYKGDVIKRFFLDYQSLNGSMTIDLSSGHVARHSVDCEGWTVHLIDTGVPTNTGGRVKRLEPWLKGETFLLTYGDGLCDIDYQELLRFHRSHGRIATVTAVRPPSRFGGLIFDGDLVTEFVEKPQVGEGWINGGFMVLEPGIFDYLDGDADSLEAGALERLAQDGQLAAYRHDRFWQCMDTLRDKRYLEGLWRDNQAPWKIWE